MQWLSDYRDIIRLYRDLKPMQRAYVLLRCLICPFGKIESQLPQAGLFVDVGCGYGLFANLLAVRAPARRVYGCDLDTRRIAVAAASTAGRDNVSFFASDVRELELPDCDVLTLIDLLHHISPDLQLALVKQCFEKLKPGGLLVVKDIDTSPRVKFAWNYLHDYLMTRGSPVSYLAREEMCRLFQRIGFKVRVQPMPTLAPYPHILYLCSKEIRSTDS